MNKYDPNIHHRRSIRLKGYDYSQAGLYYITICCQDRTSLFGEIKNGEMILNNAGKIAEKCWSEIPDHFPNTVLHAHVIMPNHVHGIIELVGANKHSPYIVNRYPTDIADKHPINIVDKHPIDIVDKHPINIADKHPIDIVDKHPIDIADKHPIDIADKHPIDIVDKHPIDIVDKHPINIADQYSPDKGGNGADRADNGADRADNGADRADNGTDRADNGTDRAESRAKDLSPLRAPSKTIGSVVRGFKIGVTKWMRQNTDVHDVWQRNYYEHIVRNEKSYQRISEYIINNPAKWSDDTFYKK